MTKILNIANETLRVNALLFKILNFEFRACFEFRVSSFEFKYLQEVKLKNRIKPITADPILLPPVVSDDPVRPAC